MASQEKEVAQVIFLNSRHTPSKMEVIRFDELQRELNHFRWQIENSEITYYEQMIRKQNMHSFLRSKIILLD